jgi:hypothetical protein
MISLLGLVLSGDQTYQGWLRTQKNAQNCAVLVITIWPMMLARTFLDTRLAVGLLGCIQGYGSVRPTIKCSITIGNITNFCFVGLTADCDGDYNK